MGDYLYQGRENQKMSRRVLAFILMLTGLLAGLIVSAQETQPGATDDRVFRVTEVLPTDGATDVPVGSRITVIFNRPVVPLGVDMDPEDLPNPLTFTPEVEGVGEWLNTSIYVFSPSSVATFAGGVDYTVEVSGIESFDGLPLEAFSWSFRTVTPRVTQVEPEPQASSIPLEGPVRVTFNQPMDQQSVQDAFTLAPDSQPEATVLGTFNWESATVMSFTPSNLLEMDTFYRARLDGNVARAANDGAFLGNESPNWTFLTVPQPAIVSTSPLDGAQGIGQFEGVVLNFASPMDEETLVGRVSIAGNGNVGAQGFYSSYNNSYRLSFYANPSTTYTVTVEPGMQDIYGNTIDQGLTFSYTTRPLDPEVRLQTPGEVGFYDGLRDTTELYLAYRNVETVNLALYDANLSEFAEIITNDPYGVSDVYMPDSASLRRDWSVDAASIPENIRRYDLLTLGASGPVGDSCPGAPPSRLQIGDIGTVITEPDPLRARSEPPSGEIVELMYRDYRFTVVDGPRCIEGIPWFQVTLRDDSLAWIAESVDGEYLVEVAGAATQGSVEVTDGDSGKLSPGLYFITADSPELPEDRSPTRHFMVVGTVNITLKAGQRELAAWVTNVHTGEPLAGVPVTFIGTAQSVFGNATTDESGLATISVEPGQSDTALAFVDTADQFGIGFAEWTRGIESYQLGVNYNRSPNDYAAYIYTDRPIYRPDQPVYYRGVLRDKTDVTYTPPTFDNVLVRVLDGNSEVLREETLPLDEFGAFSATFDLAEDASLGNYRIATYDPADPEGRPFTSLRFGVAEYRLPEYQVEVMAEQEEVVEGADLRAVVDATYFFGGPVGNADVEYRVETSDYSFRYEGEGRYSFRDVDPYNYSFVYPYGYEIESGMATTDEGGTALVDVPTFLENENGLGAELTIEATVRDETGVSVSGRSTAIVHPSEVYVGVGSESYINRSGEQVDMNLIAVDWDSEPVEEQFIDVTLERWQWVTVQEVDGNGDTVFNEEIQTDMLDEVAVVTEADGTASYSFTPEQGGVYKVIATTRDDNGNVMTASRIVWVSGSGYVGWRVNNDNTLDIITDAEDYAVGDTARILVTSPFQGETEALITVERDGILTSEHITMESNSLVYDLPITEEYAPNVFVGVMLVKGVDDTNPIAAFRYGMAQLNVDTARKIVNIEITPDRERAAPQETVTYTVRTTDYAGEPVPAQVGVALTDLAALSIAPANSGPILESFYGIQSLSVGTSTPLTINTDEITAYVREVVKGGGGGGGAGGGIFEIRSEFVDTPYWNAELETDVDGTTEFAVTLPDNLTTWRLDARAITLGVDSPFLVGQDTFDLISTRPLLVRPVTPRFFVVGDRVMLAAVVNNNTGAEQDVTSFMEIEGVTLSGDNEQTQTIPEGGRARFEWEVVVEDVDEVDVTFFATSADGEFTDASRPAVGQGDDRLLPVYRFAVRETVGTAGTVTPGDGPITEGVVLPDNLADGGQLSINANTSLAAVTVEGLDYLENYPHQCTEQTVSRFLPNIVTTNALAELGIVDPELQENLDEQVNAGLQILYSRQNIDGGWGWFSRDSSNSLVTAYVLVGLTEVMDSDQPISPQAFGGANDYLRDPMNAPLFNVPALGGQDWQYNREAFILYALSRASFHDMGRMANLYEARSRLNPLGKAYLALALDMADVDNVGDPRIDTLMTELLNSASTSAAGTFWSSTDAFNWTTDTRATAVVLEALVATRPDSELIPNVVRYLVSARTADAWETTQETAWSVMALSDWMVASNELNANYDFSVTINDETLLEDSASREAATETRALVVDVAELLQDEANRLTFEVNNGEGTLYYSAFLEASLPVDEVEPLDSGIIVSRRYVDANGETIDAAQVGDIVEVRITVVTPEDRHYVMVEDPVPAGLEPINPDLMTSSQIGTRPELENLDNGWGWWWFSDTDFRDEKAVLYSTFLPAGTYEYRYTARATVPGTYRVIPTTAEEFYFPDVYGRGAGTTFTVSSVE